jgi:hypothetical protein
MHDAQASRALVSNGQYLSTIGFDKVAAQTAGFMKGMSAPVPVEFTNDQFILFVHGTMAAVKYEETTTTPQAPTPSNSRKYQVLLKKDTG